MPYAFATHKIPLPKNKDRRRKLTEGDKEAIRSMKDEYSQRQLAKMFGVSRRLITFVLDPEKLAENKRRRAERGGWQQYYDREKHREYMKNHRRYKQEVLSEGDGWQEEI